MHCAVQFLEVTMFYWSTTMLVCMKRQITEFHRCTNKNFGIGTIFCSFFFERIPRLSPREIVQGHIASFPTMCRWEILLPIQSGGRNQEAFDEKLFDRWSCQIPLINEYPYVDIIFLRDPDMLMPPGEEHGDIGNIIFGVIKILIYIYIIFM
jgi:hypothetical protein